MNRTEKIVVSVPFVADAAVKRKFLAGRMIHFLHGMTCIHDKSRYIMEEFYGFTLDIKRNGKS